MELIRLVGVATLIALVGPRISAGDLDPPGAPAPTAPIEARIAINAENTPGNETAFFIITEPGSYHLIGNLLSAGLSSTRHGIVIEASNVTIDLNGFTLDGFQPLIVPSDASPAPRGATPTFSGILGSGERENIVIRNGIVRDWSAHGLDLWNDRGCLIDSVTVSDNVATGMRIGDMGIVRGCIAENNGDAGIVTGDGCTVTGCLAGGNAQDGLFVRAGTTVSDCSLYQNDGDGIQTQSHGTVTNCTAHENGAMGIMVASTTTVQGCTATDNQRSGIYVAGGGCLILGNICSENGNGDDAGIETGNFTFTVGNRIEGNSVTNNESTGIEVNHPGNLIIRNSASGNGTNYAIVGGNDVGTIQTSPVGAGPWDNFEP